MNEHVYTFALQKLVGAPRSLWAVRRNPHMQGLPLLHELGPRPTLSPPLEPRAKDGARRKCPHSPHPTVASSGPETRRRASLRRRCRTVPATFHTPPSWRSTTRRADARRNLSSKSLLDFPRRCRREVRTCSPNRSELLLDQTRAGRLRGKFQRHSLRRSSARTPKKWPAVPSRFFRSGEILRPRIAFDSVRMSSSF